MDPRTEHLESTTFFGKRFTRRQIAQIQETVAAFPALSRKELAQTLCEHLRWHTVGDALGNEYNRLRQHGGQSSLVHSAIARRRRGDRPSSQCFASHRQDHTRVGMYVWARQHLDGDE